MAMVREVSLPRGLHTLVDLSDFELLRSYHWWIRSGYVIGRLRRTRGPDVRMHRLIMQPEDWQVIDHIDGNPLNNVRSNLRVCVQSQNTKNRRKSNKQTSSQFKGVWFAHAYGGDKPWRAQVRVNGKVTYLGSYSTEVEAAMAYDLAALKYYGEYSLLNFGMNELAKLKERAPTR